MRERFWEEMSVNFTSASSPTMNGKMPHIQCTAEEIGEIVLLPGDPGRVAMFEGLLEDYKIVSNYREYVVGTGYYNGIKVTVCSTGIGGPSTEIAVLQLTKTQFVEQDRKYLEMIVLFITHYINHLVDGVILKT